MHAATQTAPRRLRPLTERILARLPGRREAWIALWALVPWANAGANVLLDTEGSVWDQSRTLVILNYAALSFAMVITLWGSERIPRRLETLPAATAAVIAGNETDRFREMNSVVGPLLAAAGTGLAFGVEAFVRDGLTSGLLRGVTWFVLGVAVWTFLWTYGALQLGLDRLGRERLDAESARVDPSLGLRPVGDIAFVGLWMLFAWLVPVLVTALPDVVGVTSGLVVLAGGLAAFVLSLLRLHRRMAEVRQSELAFARELYAAAYEPVRTAGTLEALERQQPLLGAADALEKRAQALHEWPVSEGTVARVVTITTSVLAIGVARLILNPLGL